MIWDEPPVRLLLQKSNADVIIVSACAYGWDIYKRWAFASTFRYMQQLAAKCRHPEGSHAPVAGVQDSSGGYISQQTSEFPEPVASKSAAPVDVAPNQLLQLLPTKGQFDPPFAHQDGAGIFSVPDWSFPPSGAVDRLCQVRQALTAKLFEMKAPLRLREHVASKSEQPLFSDQEVSEFRAVFQEFLEASSGRKVGWSVKPHQPYALQALRQPDTSLFPSLLEGAPSGLAGITFQGRTFFYRVMPFGMSCSAYWWQRLSGFLVRTWHGGLLWLSHFLSSALDISACLILAFAAVFGVRLSWPKLQLGSSVVWIGWSLNYRAGTVQVTATKKEKLSRVLRPLLGEGRVELRDLQKALGLWAYCSGSRSYMWSCVRGCQFSMMTLLACLNDTLIFITVPLTSKRIWLRITDPQSRFRRLSKLSRKLLLFWHEWSQAYHFHECFHLPPRHLDCVMAADAFASGEELGIGGFIEISGSQPVFWFSERYRLSDFKYLDLPLHQDAQRDISCWETLAQAQVGLMLLFSHLCPGGRIRLTLPSFSDNTGAEAVCAKLLTTKSPLCFFAQLVAMVSTRLGISLDVQHISGERNEDADLLSRWDGIAPLAPLGEHWDLDMRYRFSVQDFFDQRHDVRLFPSDARLLWKLPR
ncbi:unnamed protein product [Symbiodinium necroappetens]|uniref:Uncharacterized protein n=1 Tax=Symbiodinium necroappetens TaxID=1628268 RepID=A0A812VEJ5_9DINO|nr:unnamed protein product [Symbiodinium necroappetens]